MLHKLKMKLFLALKASALVQVLGSQPSLSGLLRFMPLNIFCEQKLLSAKILFVSGYPQEEVLSKLPSGMNHIYFLPKPFSLDDLVRKIQDLCSDL